MTVYVLLPKTGKPIPWIVVKAKTKEQAIKKVIKFMKDYGWTRKDVVSGWNLYQTEVY